MHVSIHLLWSNSPHGRSKKLPKTKSNEGHWSCKKSGGEKVLPCHKVSPKSTSTRFIVFECDDEDWETLRDKEEDIRDMKIV